MKQKQNNKPGPDKAWRFTPRFWRRFEPDERYLPDGKDKTPLLYVRFHLNSDARLGVSRGEFEYERRCIFEAGGAELWGWFGLLVMYAADSAFCRGELTTPRGKAAAPREIAAALGLPARHARAIGKAIDSLADLGILEKIRDEAKSSSLPPPGQAKDSQPAASDGIAESDGSAERIEGGTEHSQSSGEGGTGPQDGPGSALTDGDVLADGQRADNAQNAAGDAGQERSPSQNGPASMPGPEPPEASGTSGAARADCRNDPANCNQNSRANAREQERLTACGQTANGTKKTTAAFGIIPGCGSKPNGNGTDTGRKDGPANGNGNPNTNTDGQTDAATESATAAVTMAAETAAADAVPPSGGAGGGVSSGTAPSRPPAGMAQNGGQADGPVRQPDGELWQRFADIPILWNLVRHDESGAYFSEAIARVLRLPAAMSIRLRRRETGTFRAAWSNACMIGLNDQELLDLCEAGIRKALALGNGKKAWQIKPRGVEPRWGAIWISWWKERMAKAVCVMIARRRTSGPPGAPVYAGGNAARAAREIGEENPSSAGAQPESLEPPAAVGRPDMSGTVGLGEEQGGV